MSYDTRVVYQAFPSSHISSEPHLVLDSTTMLFRPLPASGLSDEIPSDWCRNIASLGFPSTFSLGSILNSQTFLGLRHKRAAGTANALHEGAFVYINGTLSLRSCLVFGFNFRDRTISGMV